MMKMNMAFTILSTIILSASAYAEIYKEVVLSDTQAVNPARIQKVISLYKASEETNYGANDGLNVNIVVEDLGGSTDVSPTQKVYLTLFDKQEMFSTTASFPVGTVFKVLNASRVSRGVYQIKVMAVGEDSNPTAKTLTVNAVKAIDAIKAVDCKGEFDCKESSEFKSSVEVIWK